MRVDGTEPGARVPNGGDKAHRTAGRISAALGTYALVGGIVTLLGWWLGIPRLTDWENNGISQMPNSGIGVVAAGAALLLMWFGQRMLASVIGAAAFLIGGATLFQYITTVDLGIDRLLFVPQWGQRGALVTGRMGPPGATSMTIIGLSLMLAGFRRTRRLAVIGALSTASIALLSLIGYLFGVDTLYTIPKLTTISFQAATMFLALGIGLVVAIPEIAPMKTLLEDSAAALIVRRTLPGVILLPLILGSLHARGQQEGLFDPVFGTSLMVVVLMVLLTALLWWSAAAVRVQETARRESHARLCDVLDSITDAFMSFDANGRFGFINDQAEVRLGKRRAELLGKTMSEAFPETANTGAHRQLKLAMAGRTSVDYDMFHAPTQRWFAERAYPTADGGLSVFSRDVTDYKRAEARLRESRERVQLAISIADAATWDLDLVTGENHWSDSHFTMLGYAATRDGIATTEMWQGAIVAEDLPRVMAEWARAERDQDVFRSEHRLRRVDDGRILWASAAGRFFYDANGKASRFVGVFYDVTKRNRNEEELRRLAAELRDADRRKDEFLATLAHELRNPLAPIRTSLEVIKQSPGDLEVRDRALWTMDRQVNQMVRLIDDLLDVSRITRNKLELRPERVELAPVVQQAAEACASLVAGAGQELILIIPPAHIFLNADPTRLSQVFGNLITNASKYTDAGGKIWVTVERHGDHVEVSVKDTGVGISADMLPKVFDMFTQVDRHLNRAQGGLGVGLTLVKRLIELHDGSVTAKSDGPGKGTTFRVRLPVLDIEKADPPEAAKGVPARPAPRRILVVDDNQDAAETLAMLFEIQGHEVQTAADGVEAIMKAEQFRPQTILLDIGLPRMNGYDACRAIREHLWAKNILIVALTGWGQEDDRRKSVEAGFDAHMVKPVDHAALTALLASRG